MSKHAASGRRSGAFKVAARRLRRGHVRFRNRFAAVGTDGLTEYERHQDLLRYDGTPASKALAVEEHRMHAEVVRNKFEPVRRPRASRV